MQYFRTGIGGFRFRLYITYTCEGLDDNLKVTKAWIIKKYCNKMLTDTKITMDTLVDDMKTMHRVIVVP